jgi:hypothetical protein
LARFVDQAGLFLADRAVTNKLHFVSLPGVVVAWMLLGTGRGEFQLPPALPGYALGMISGQKGPTLVSRPKR